MAKGQNTSRLGIGGSRRRCAVLAGSWEDLCELYGALAQGGKGVRVDAVFTDGASWQVPEGLAQPGGTVEVLTFLQEGGQADDVYYVIGSLDRQQTLRLYGLCQERGAECHAVPPCEGLLRRRMKVENRWPALSLTLRKEPLAGWCARLWKRCTDLLLSLVVLLTVFPLVYLAVLVFTKWKRRGPVFSAEEICGPDGRAFHSLRYRALDGRLSLMPRFFCVLTGKMSLVGPAPMQPDEADEYRRLLNRYVVRFAPKAGLATCSGTGEGYEDGRLARRVESDVRYAENWSPWVDLKLMLGGK